MTVQGSSPANATIVLRLKKTIEEGVERLQNLEEQKACFKMKSYHLLKQDWNNDVTCVYMSMGERNFTRAKPQMKSYRQSMASERDNHFSPGTRTLIGYPNSSCQP